MDLTFHLIYFYSNFISLNILLLYLLSFRKENACSSCMFVIFVHTFILESVVEFVV